MLPGFFKSDTLVRQLNICFRKNEDDVGDMSWTVGSSPSIPRGKQTNKLPFEVSKGRENNEKRIKD